jgi:hypothetical protein
MTTTNDSSAQVTPETEEVESKEVEASTEAPEAQGNTNTEGSKESAVEAKEAPSLLSADKLPLEKYELKLPENAMLQPEDVVAVEAYAKEHKLSNEVAQTILEQRNDAMAKFSERAVKQVEEVSAKWYEEIKNDKEFGGERLPTSASYANKVLSKYGGDEFIKELNGTPYKNHPGFFKFLARLGKDVLSNDELVQATSTNTKKEVPLEAIWFPNLQTRS